MTVYSNVRLRLCNTDGSSDPSAWRHVTCRLVRCWETLGLVRCELIITRIKIKVRLSHKDSQTLEYRCSKTKQIV